LEDEVWKKFFRKHWEISILFVIAIVVAVIGAFLVLLWFKDYAQAITLVPEYLGNWSIGTAVTLCLHLLFWEFILIGIPAIAVAGVCFLWWRKLPEEEKKEYKGEPKKRTQDSGFFSFLIWIAWLIIVYTDDMLFKPFVDALWTFDYLMSSWIWAVIWVLIICGIPMVVGGVAVIIYFGKKK
ncbi:hypothetical protein KAI31_04590, partial [Candidatus Bathyarchaeota archaeon]|nr:hypothetical protein [Candidatus Bathyarchaeota archaeon]